jgi:hypothetical protein
VSDVLRIAQWSVGVFSIWFVLSDSFCLFVILSLVILLPFVSTAELRLDDFLVDELCGRSLYIGGVDRLGERTKHNHFYLFSGSLPLREYHLASKAAHTHGPGLTSARRAEIKGKATRRVAVGDGGGR